MGNKIFKTLDEQIRILRDKGLIINDEEKAEKILFRENYFFITGYRHFFMDSNKEYLKGTNFTELYALFTFDRNIRNLMFKNILIIENNIKSIISYQLSRKYGIKETEYLDPKNYTQDPEKAKQVRDIMSKMKRQIRSNAKEHTATYHYMNSYGYIPMWVMVKVLSFGIVAELYTILKREDQEAIAEAYEIDVETLSVYLSLLSNYRNVCAHEEILYDYRPQRRIPDTMYHYKLNLPKDGEGEYLYGKNDIFALLIILKEMLDESQFKDLINEFNYEVDLLDAKVYTVSLISIYEKIGIPKNWREVCEIK